MASSSPDLPGRSGPGDPAARSARDGSPRPRVALFASGRGRNVAALLDAIHAGRLDVDVAFVLSNRSKAAVLERARARGVETRVVTRKGRDRAGHEAEILEVLREGRVDLVLLAGYMRVLGSTFLRGFPGYVLNIHPSLLPEFPGLDAQGQQWDAGVKVAGATVHLVDEGVDTGPAILQGSLEVRGDEGREGLAGRILEEVELSLYPRAAALAVERMARGVPLAPGAALRPHLDVWNNSSPRGAAPDPEPTQTNEEAPVVIGRIRRALLSVSDKTGIVDFARGLHEREVALVASGGTAAAIEEAGVPVTRVEEWTGAPEVLGGRVKTLNPAVHAALLADRRDAGHLAELEANGYGQIDLVVCNLYPFRETVAKGADIPTCIENIDIGGPTMLRAAAKNHAGGVTVVTEPAEYPAILELLKDEGRVPDETRARLAAQAFRRTAEYDAAVSEWTAKNLAGDSDRGASLTAGFSSRIPLRYGENPHQDAALVVGAGERRGVAHGELLCGKALSYNNYLDLDGAYRAVDGLEGPACSVVKHTNPCGLAVGASQVEAFERALSGDPVSAFGSILGFNAPLEGATAQAIKDSKLFVECIVAPEFTAEALALFKKRKNLRLFRAPPGSPLPAEHMHRIGGGFLVQAVDEGPAGAELEVVTKTGLEDGWREELLFAMHAVWQLKSNAIAVTSERTLRGAGAGHMSRVDACELALRKAGDATAGAFLASDAFFPFDDCVRLAAEKGVKAIIQPGGSKRDPEVIAACDELGIAMVFTGRRHFRH